MKHTHSGVLSSASGHENYWRVLSNFKEPSGHFVWKRVAGRTARGNWLKIVFEKVTRDVNYQVGHATGYATGHATVHGIAS